MHSIINIARSSVQRIRHLGQILSWRTSHHSSDSSISYLLDSDHFWRENKNKRNKTRSEEPNMSTLEGLKFDNLVLRTLPIDDEKGNFTRTVPGACFSLIAPTPVENPELVVHSESAMNLLDLGEREIMRSEFVQYFSGNKILPGSETASHCYCGHQFGYFSGQLGDGAAIYLGEVLNSEGNRWEIQLKGAGKTPYSRHADGRKVLRSSIREFLCSEAMHHLGIPSTRAGCCITSDSKVVRDIFYSGDQIQEKCTIVLRLAETFIRFGSFEIFKPTDMETGRAGPSVNRKDILELMLQYVVKTFYHQIWENNIDNKEAAYLEFYTEIVHRTAKLVADWQCVGFCHGVLNTDNMSIVGLTIDYGPYGFMDKFEQGFVCNSSDDGGRYSYDKQPEMCKWNCKKLAEALSPVVPMEKMEAILETYDNVYEQNYMLKIRKKFGLINSEKPEDKELIESFLTTMEETGADFTNSFRCLSKLVLPGMPDFKASLEEVTLQLLSQCCTLEELKEACKPRMDPRQLNTFVMLMQMNPELLSQLGAGHRSISQELGRIEKSKELKDATQEKKSADDKVLWTAWLNKYTERLKQEEQGSSDDLQKVQDERVKVMNANNPRFILRNYIAQAAIEKAEKGDYSEVRKVLAILEQPYSDSPQLESLQGGVQNLQVSAEEKDQNPSASAAAATKGDICHVIKNFDDKPPTWASDLRVS